MKLKRLGSNKDLETFCPSNQAEWRNWLLENHSSKKSVWLILYKKKTQIPTISWSVAVDEALCFGWIDSTKRPIDDEKYMQFFTTRKPKSTWSKINKEKVAQLIKQGLMTKAGFASIEIAKQNGSWSMMDEVENLIIPTDLITAFESHPNSKEYFLSLSKSKRKIILYWIVAAKRPETRQKRILETVNQASKQKLPKQFQ